MCGRFSRGNRGARDGACILFVVRDTPGTKIRGKKGRERKERKGSRSSRLASGVVIRGAIGSSLEEKLAGTNKYLLTNPQDEEPTPFLGQPWPPVDGRLPEQV